MRTANLSARAVSYLKAFKVYKYSEETWRAVDFKLLWSDTSPIFETYTIFLGNSRSYCVMAAPSSAERKACWNARDQLWKCLDDNNDNASSCHKFQSEFEGNCPAQWVKYFTKRRDFLKYKARMETEGFSPAEGPKQPS